MEAGRPGARSRRRARLPKPSGAEGGRRRAWGRARAVLGRWGSRAAAGARGTEGRRGGRGPWLLLQPAAAGGGGRFGPSALDGGRQGCGRVIRDGGLEMTSNGKSGCSCDDDICRAFRRCECGDDT